MYLCEGCENKCTFEDDEVACWTGYCSWTTKNMKGDLQKISQDKAESPHEFFGIEELMALQMQT